MKPYVIRQGDYLVKLAHVLGFDAEEVWNAAKNAKLRQERKSHNMLVPGDILFVPDEPAPRSRLDAMTSNTYVAHVPRVRVRMRMAVAGTPMKNEAYVVRGIGEDAKERKTDGEGTVAFEADVHVREVEIHFPARELTRTVAIGGLDPIEAPSGLRMRLTHLGFYSAHRGGADGHTGRDENRLDAAVKAFQSANGIAPSGELDPSTKRAIVAAHGS